MGSFEDYPEPWWKTPLVESAALSKAAGCRVFLKLDNLQPSGSFKSRGVGNFILSRIRENHGKPGLHFYSSSGGNAGLACVVAARSLGYPATVVVPMSTKPLMISKLLAAGATDVIQEGASWAFADRHLRDVILANNPNGIYVPPFDHEDIWEGHSFLVHELKEQLRGETPDVVICSVGGGGLFNGIMRGLDDVGWSSHVTVLAVETEGAESLNKSILAKKLVTLPGITSMATSLGAVTVAPKAFENGMRPNVKSVVLPDAEAAMGCWRLADDERLLVELSCGVSVALCYDGRLEKMLGKKVTPDTKVVVEVCGGSNVTIEMLAGWRQEFAWVEKTMPHSANVPSSLTAP